jgi:hypothetical protein
MACKIPPIGWVIEVPSVNGLNGSPYTRYYQEVQRGRLKEADFTESIDEACVFPTFEEAELCRTSSRPTLDDCKVIPIYGLKRQP